MGAAAAGFAPPPDGGPSCATCSAMNAWSASAVMHLEATSPELVSVLRRRLDSLSSWSTSVFPQVVHSLPVLYLAKVLALLDVGVIAVRQRLARAEVRLAETAPRAMAIRAMELKKVFVAPRLARRRAARLLAALLAHVKRAARLGIAGVDMGRECAREEDAQSDGAHIAFQHARRPRVCARRPHNVIL